jgi:hypothetical protein
MLRIPHCLDNLLTDGTKVVSPTHWRRSTSKKNYFSASGTHLCQRLSEPQSLVRLEWLGKLKKINSPHQIFDLTVRSLVPQLLRYRMHRNFEANIILFVLRNHSMVPLSVIRYFGQAPTYLPFIFTYFHIFVGKMECLPHISYFKNKCIFMPSQCYLRIHAPPPY